MCKFRTSASADIKVLHSYPCTDVDNLILDTSLLVLNKYIHNKYISNYDWLNYELFKINYEYFHNYNKSDIHCTLSENTLITMF